MIPISIVFFTTLLKIGELVLFCALGYVLMRWGKLPKDTPSALSKLLTLLFCPALTFSALYGNLDLPSLQANGSRILISTVIMFALCPISRFLAKKISRGDESMRQLLCYNLYVSNYGYIGYPLISGVFGEEALCRFLLFCIPFTIMTNTYGRMVLQGEKKITFNFLFSPLTLSLVFGILLPVCNIKIPSVIDNVLITSGNCLGPVSMLLAGMVLSRCPLKDCLLRPLNYLLSALRLVILPLAAVFVLYVFGFRGEILLFIGCVLCMPFGTNPVIFRESIGQNSDSAVSTSCPTYIFALITVPLLFSLFSIL